MTRKRFIKLLMSMGIDRNSAYQSAANLHGLPYPRPLLCLLIKMHLNELRREGMLTPKTVAFVKNDTLHFEVTMNRRKAATWLLRKAEHYNESRCAE